jgi:hypothetical protein
MPSRRPPSLNDPDFAPQRLRGAVNQANMGLHSGGLPIAKPMPRPVPDRRAQPVPATGGGGGAGGIIGAAIYKDTRSAWNAASNSIVIPSTLDSSQGDVSGIGYDGTSQSLIALTAGWYMPWSSCHVAGVTVATIETICGGNGGNAINTSTVNSAYSTKAYCYALGEPFYYTVGNTFRTDVYGDGTPLVNVNAHVGVIALTGGPP